MNIEIAPDDHEFVLAAIQSGEYQSESEVMHQAIGLLRRRKQVRRDVQVGLDQLDRGEGIPHEEVKRQLARWLAS